MSCITKKVQDYLDDAYDRFKDDLETEIAEENEAKADLIRKYGGLE